MTPGCFWATTLPTIIKIFKIAMKYWCITWVQPFSLPGIFGSKRAALLKNLAEHCTVPCFQFLFQMTPMKRQRGRRSSQDTHSEECNWCCEGPAMQNWSNHKHLSSVCCRVQHTTYSIYRVQHTTYSIYKNCKSMHKYNKMQCWYLVCKVLCCFWHLLPTLEDVN